MVTRVGRFECCNSKAGPSGDKARATNGCDGAEPAWSA